jgi:hypothetical protein
LPGEISFNELKRNISADANSAKSLHGVLCLLHVLGLITFTPNIIRVTSKQAHFALGSIGKYCKGSVQVVSESLEYPYEENYLVEFTRALETMRTYQKCIDNNPLNERCLINVVVKGRQIRNGRKQDVFLHVHHPKWQAYHFVGTGYNIGLFSPDEAAALALEQKMGLQRHQYKLAHLMRRRFYRCPFIRVSGCIDEIYSQH